MSWNKRSTPFKEPAKKKPLRECCVACIENKVSCPVNVEIQQQISLKKDALKKEKDARRGAEAVALELQREIQNLGEKECRHWIDYEDDLNCVLIAIENNGRMTLREAAERLNVSFVRVKQIQDKGLKKLTKLKNKNILKSFE
tara:strand:- start:109 stop:537 length:429 start_codon:yes stop_codon:yes gene_type:complete